MPRIPRLITLLAGGIAVIAAPLSALADSVQADIGGKTLTLALPDGHCAMDRSNASDARLIELVEKGAGNRNEVVLAFADCTQLKDWREGRRLFLDDFGQYQTLIAAKGQDFTGAESALVKQVCDAQRDKGEGLFDNAVSTVNDQLQKQQEKMSVNEINFLGIYSENAKQCSSSFIQKVTAENGESKTLFGISTTTILKGKVLYYNFYTKYVDEASLTVIRTKHGDALNDLLAAN